MFLLFIPHSFLYSEIGVRFGTNITNQSWEYSELDLNRNFENRFGPNIGVNYKILELNYFDLYADVSYCQMRTSEKMKGTLVWQNQQGYIDADVITLKNEFDFISFALLAHLKPFQTKLNPYLCFGPRVDYLHDKHSNYNSIVIKNFNNYVYGIVIGVGFEIHAYKSSSVVIESTVNTDVSYLYNTDQLSVKKSSYNLVVGYNL
ncbi:MAG: PorT family protein [Candidatus Marinimicrobia bacterium]|nr:PorT family protein [Candidatus Neomarinimicrobiota bacterium]